MPVEDPEVGAYRFARTPPTLSSNADLPAMPAPRLGQHSREVLADVLGFDDARIESLASEGVVQLGD
jgi:crotonobetainyl-CoA:carnitine CoA-transferase CaiB-like acyl-CoA transferase